VSHRCLNASAGATRGSGLWEALAGNIRVARATAIGVDIHSKFDSALEATLVSEVAVRAALHAVLALRAALAVAAGVAAAIAITAGAVRATRPIRIGAIRRVERLTLIVFTALELADTRDRTGGRVTVAAPGADAITADAVLAIRQQALLSLVTRRVVAGPIDALTEARGTWPELADRGRGRPALDALPFEAVGTVGGADAGRAVRATDVAGDARAAAALLPLLAAGRVVGAAGVLSDAGLAAALLSCGAVGLVLGAATPAFARGTGPLETEPLTAGGGEGAAAGTAKWLAARTVLANGSLLGIVAAAVLVLRAIASVHTAVEAR
jgi:hypothetical protein